MVARTFKRFDRTFTGFDGRDHNAEFIAIYRNANIREVWGLDDPIDALEELREYYRFLGMKGTISVYRRECVTRVWEPGHSDPT